MPALDTTHTWALTINGADFYPYLLRGTLRVAEAEGSQIDTLACVLEDTGWAGAPVEWQEIMLTADGTTKIFGGYVTKLTPKVGPGLDNLQYDVGAESYLTLAARTPRIRKSYVLSSVATIVTDLFSQAGLTGFDTTTHVNSAITVDKFNSPGLLLSEALDKITQLGSEIDGETWACRIDADKKLWLGRSTSDPAPFGIADITLADYVTTFPPSDIPSVNIDATQVRNRVTVRGGTTASAVQTDTFTGDGATKLFKLTYKPVRHIESILLDDTYQRHGWDWIDGWYDENGDGYNCLVDYECGTVRFPDAAPPGNGLALVVKYRYDTSVQVVRTSAASYALYGRYLDYEIQDGSITDQTGAEQAGDAMLRQYEFGTRTGSLVVERLGIKAGQRLHINFPLLSLNDYYVARQVSTELGPGVGGVKATIGFGDMPMRLSRTVGGAGGTPAYDQGSRNPNSGSTRSAWVDGYDGVGEGDFTP